ncbi:MAG: crossover junction endodeoxyribonuclease RuvC [Deltaproteobacteria bacterium]|nr:crossover junction endodeoxyribonuclease RuvC [Deltaproteobacteria bacterium]
MRILGIDPGSRAMGYGIVEVEKSVLTPIVHGTLRPPTGADLAIRLASLQEGLIKILEEYRPHAASVESAFVAMNPRSALVLGHARGVALASIASHRIPLAEYSPTQVKAAVVGSGRAEKQQVQQMVQILLKLDKVPGQDAADALAAAICHAHGGKLAGVRSGRSRSRRGGGSGLVVRRMR